MRYLLPLAAAVLLLAVLPPATSAQPLGVDDRGTTAPVTAPADRSDSFTEHLLSEVLPVFYVVDRRPMLRAGPGTGATLGRLDFRRGVRVKSSSNGWKYVEDVETGESLGWVEETALSNVWLLIDKRSRMLVVYQGAEVLRRMPIDVSMNPDDDKERLASGDSDHYRIPEGSYMVTNRNPNSQYYRSFMLNYPNAEDADRGLAQGLITRAQHRAIVNAAENFQPAPLGTRLGGAIAIHGQGSGRQRAWTQGCVALRDVHIDMLWDIVRVGTPVFIR